MKTKRLFVITAIAMLGLTACGRSVKAAPYSTQEIISSAYTSVALTSISQLQATPTPVVMPTATFMPTTVSTPVITVWAPTDASDDAPPSTAVAKVEICDNSAYVSEGGVVDGTVLSPGETFTKTWKVRNTGTCTWNRRYALAFISGDSMSGETTTIHRAVLPNGTSNILMTLVAPDTAGYHTGYWTMINSNGTAFGNSFYVNIFVVSDDEDSLEDETQSME